MRTREEIDAALCGNNDRVVRIKMSDLDAAQKDINELKARAESAEAKLALWDEIEEAIQPDPDGPPLLDVAEHGRETITEEASLLRGCPYCRELVELAERLAPVLSKMKEVGK